MLDWSNFKAFGNDKINVTQKLRYVYGRVENNVGKGENAGYQHFSFSHNVFTIGIVKSLDCVVRSYTNHVVVWFLCRKID